MSLRADILDLLRARGRTPNRAVHVALADLLDLVADEHPDLPPLEASPDDADGDDDDAGLAVRTIDCPHCAEPVVVELELDGGDQETIQDCSVCCRPIQLTWRVQGGKLAHLTIS